MIDKNIRIKNVYHMICYAWQYAREGSEVDYEWESMGTLDDLLTSMMVSGVDYIRRRGFYHEYHPVSDELPTIKGRIDVMRSSLPRTKMKKVSLCEYDEYDMNNQMNRILLSTLNSMYRESKGKIRKGISRLMPFFNGVDNIVISKSSFNMLTYDRNNSVYRVLINVCELYWANKMSNEEQGKHRFVDLTNDSRMNIIFEKFILNYYKVKCPQYLVNADRYGWRLIDSPTYPDYLPYLRTDAVIKDKKRMKMLIVDAKYYEENLESNHDKRLVRNAHLAQVYAYMHNNEHHHQYSVQGMLIYPLVDNDINTTFPIEGGSITVHTLNLNKDWIDIESDLMSYLDVCF